MQNDDATKRSYGCATIGRRSRVPGRRTGPMSCLRRWRLVRTARSRRRSGVLAAVPKQDPPSGQLVSVVPPIVLTSLFSLFVYRVTGMADKVDWDSKALQARLAHQITRDVCIYQAITRRSEVRERQTMRGASVDGRASTPA